MLYSRLSLTALLMLQAVSFAQGDHLNQMYQKFAGNIEGQWHTAAWAGELYETWRIDPGDDLIQNAVYFEKSDTTYRAQSHIKIVDDTLILFTVIRNSNPKIFQATSISADSIVFENSDYKNPSKVIYRLLDDNNFQRTISGFEDDHPVSYTFNFKRR